MHTFVLLIAIRYFQPGPMFKAILPACISVGLLISPLVLSLTSKAKIKATHWASLFWASSGLLMFSSSYANTFSVFLLCIAPSLLCYALVPTFMIFAYSENYTAKQRGQRIATFFVISSLAAGGFAFGGGYLLDANIDNFRWILRMIGLSALASALLAFYMPSPVVEAKHSSSGFSNLSLSWKDRLFGWILLSWMCIGFANLMTIPLRVEYMAQPEYGVAATNEQITFVIVLIPAICRILSTRVWGFLFDSMNLLTLRTVLNALLIISIFIFFRYQDLTMLIIAMAIHGVAHGGGNVAWSLWVTKIAPPDKTGAYMSVHTAFTGMRGFVSPFVGFLLITYVGPVATSMLALILAALSIVIQVPLIQHPRLKVGK